MAADDPYDLVPYGDYAWQETHPDRLAAVAWLRGVDAPPIEAARVLEIGCAGGSNLLAMADGLPGGTFVGLDRSGKQIAQAEAHRAALGFDHLTFVQADLSSAEDLAHPALQGPFDYIVCHGLWAWVPAAARAGIVTLLGRLAEGGVAYVSADILPGARLRQMSRDLLHFHDPTDDPPEERMQQALGVLQAVSEAAPENSVQGQFLRKEYQLARDNGSSFLFHDRLSDHYAPMLLVDMVREAKQAGLCFLGDACPSLMLTAPIPAALRAPLDAANAPLELGLQYADFVMRRVFRRVLFTRSEAPLGWPPELERVSALHVRGNVAASSVQGDGALGIEGAVLDRVSAVYPESVPAADLVEGLDPVARERVLALLVQTWLAESLHLLVRPSPVTRAAPERPRAPAFSRRCAARGGDRFVNALHGMVRVEPLHRALVPALDGAHDRAALLDVAVQAAVDGAVEVRVGERRVSRPEALRPLVDEMLDEALEELAHVGLLWAE